MTDKPGSLIMPTGANIKKALSEMIGRAESGDVLFFHYSGHGTLIKPKNSLKKEEAIVPCDFNLITSKFPSTKHITMLFKTTTNDLDLKA